MNKQLYKLYHVTENDYLQWCEEHNKAHYKSSVRTDFIHRLADGRLVKDYDTGKLKRVIRRKKK